MNDRIRGKGDLPPLDIAKFSSKKYKNSTQVIRFPSSPYGVKSAKINQIVCNWLDMEIFLRRRGFDGLQEYGQNVIKLKKLKFRLDVEGGGDGGGNGEDDDNDRPGNGKSLTRAMLWSWFGEKTISLISLLRKPDDLLIHIRDEDQTCRNELQSTEYIWNFKNDDKGRGEVKQEGGPKTGMALTDDEIALEQALNQGLNAFYYYLLRQDIISPAEEFIRTSKHLSKIDIEWLMPIVEDEGAEPLSKERFRVDISFAIYRLCEAMFTESIATVSLNRADVTKRMGQLLEPPSRFLSEKRFVAAKKEAQARYPNWFHNIRNVDDLRAAYREVRELIESLRDNLRDQVYLRRCQLLTPLILENWEAEARKKNTIYKGSIPFDLRTGKNKKKWTDLPNLPESTLKEVEIERKKIIDWIDGPIHGDEDRKILRPDLYKNYLDLHGFPKTRKWFETRVADRSKERQIITY